MKKKIPSYCAQCRSRCGCLAVVKDEKLLSIEPLPRHPTGKKLCPKGKAAPQIIYHKARLLSPLKRKNPKTNPDPGWEPISWDEALNQIAKKMLAIRERHGAEQVAFSVTTPSGTNISDSIGWIQRFIRVFGSPNTIYSTEICNWHKDYAARFTFGTDIGTPDFENTDCVLLWGNNPEETWLARSIEIRKALKRGAKLIVIDPRPTRFARIADCWIRPRPGSDQEIALCLAHLLIDSKKFDKNFIKNWTNAPLLVRSDTGYFLRESELKEEGSENICFGYDQSNQTLVRYDISLGIWLDSITHVATSCLVEVSTTVGNIRCETAFFLYSSLVSRYAPVAIEEFTGVPQKTLHKAANILSTVSSVAYYAWNGVSQSTNATQTDRAISLLYTLTGSYGSVGGNVAGVAAEFHDISGTDLISEKQKLKALGLEKRPLGPGLMGWVTGRDVYRAIVKRQPYPVRMLFSFGGNLLSAQPDTRLAHKALQKLDFHVHADFFLNPTANFADIVLPVSTAWEREGLQTGFDASLKGMKWVQLRKPVVEAIGQSRSDIEIVMGLAKLLGFSSNFFDLDADQGHNHILSRTGITVGQLRRNPAGVMLHTNVPFKAFGEVNPNGHPRGFQTGTRKIEVYSEKLLRKGYHPIPLAASESRNNTNNKLPLILGCAKTVAFCHSQHRHIALLRKLRPDPTLEIAPKAAKKRRISEGDWVEISTESGAFLSKAKIVKDLQPDSVFAQHGWLVNDLALNLNSRDDGSMTNMNTAVSSSKEDPISGSLPLRFTWCEVKKLSKSAFTPISTSPSTNQMG